MTTVIVGLILAGACGLVVARMVRNRKKGSACTGCQGCSACASCPSSREGSCSHS